MQRFVKLRLIVFSQFQSPVWHWADVGQICCVNQLVCTFSHDFSFENPVLLVYLVHSGCTLTFGRKSESSPAHTSLAGRRRGRSLNQNDNNLRQLIESGNSPGREPPQMRFERPQHWGVIWKPDKTPHTNANYLKSFPEHRLCVQGNGVLCRQLGSCGFLSGNHIYIVRIRKIWIRENQLCVRFVVLQRPRSRTPCVCTRMLSSCLMRSAVPLHCTPRPYPSRRLENTSCMKTCGGTTE